MTAPLRRSVLEVTELAAYLRLWRQMPGLDEQLQRLRTADHYASSLFEMMIGARLRLLSSFVTSAPPIGSRKADFAVSAGDRRMYVECAMLSDGEQVLRYRRLVSHIADAVERMAEQGLAPSLSASIFR